MNTNTSTITPDSVLLQTKDVLEKVLPQSNSVPQSMHKSLDEMFPEQEYQEKQIKRAKEILGIVGNELTDIQLQGVVAEILYLAETWLDEFEREVFDGLTLNELLHEKGGT